MECTLPSPINHRPPDGILRQGSSGLATTGDHRDVPHWGAQAPKGEFLRIGLGGGMGVETVGSLERRETPPEDGWAFYCNDFQLSEARPWIVPADIRFFQAAPSRGAEGRRLAWQTPVRGPFEQVMQEIFQQFHAGSLLKAVPAVTAEAAWEETLWPALLERCFAARSDLGSHPYAWQIGEEAACGLTPEVLFRLEAGELRTMALAGTVPAGQEALLLTNEKLVREHETVVASLVERLTPLGELHREARRIMPLNGMCHLCTKLRMTLDLPEHPMSPWRPERILPNLISLLHPTPALGVAPRTVETLAQLKKWRDVLGVPRHFGAPLGVKWPGGILMLVSIRGVFRLGGKVLLPTGCGVVQGSRIDEEWQEMALKRNWVQQALGC